MALKMLFLQRGRIFLLSGRNVFSILARKCRKELATLCSFKSVPKETSTAREQAVGGEMSQSGRGFWKMW
jgi:hypothetical protein